MKLTELYAKVKENVGKVIVGKDDIVDMMAVCLFAGGHMLLEDVPGTGKTMTVKALAASLDCSFRRIQFTPDLLPSDITGVNFFNMQKSAFEFIKGPVFSNILLADEINRATPKTQSGLLECMEEYQATIDGKTYPLAMPFMVIATQNPVENMGVFPLPEAQLDRFLMKAGMSYPTQDEEADILDRFNGKAPLEKLTAVASKDDIIEARKELDAVFVHRDVQKYIVSICEATRENESVVLGVSPRGALALQKTAKGYAAIAGRSYVKPDDVKKAAVPTLAHRLILTSGAKIKKGAQENVITDIIEKIPVPTEYTIEKAVR